MNIYFTLASYAVVLSTGMLLENEFHLASQTLAAYGQVKIAQKGEAAIINDTQNLTKDIRNDKKDPCINATEPADIRKQLQ